MIRFYNRMRVESAPQVALPTRFQRKNVVFHRPSNVRPIALPTHFQRDALPLLPLKGESLGSSLYPFGVLGVLAQAEGRCRCRCKCTRGARHPPEDPRTAPRGLKGDLQCWTTTRKEH
jgi:hypothetical protein